MFAVTFALPEESASFRKLLRRTGRKGQTDRNGIFDPGDVRVWHLGVGPARARAQVRQFFMSAPPAAVCAAGFAGALDPRLRVGDLVIDERLSDASLVAAARRMEGDPYPFFSHGTASGDSSLGADAREPAVWFGAITSVDSVVETVSAKQALRHRSGAMAVDMESASIADECRRAEVPLIVLRAISDDAHRDLPVPMQHWFDVDRQRPKPAALVRYLATHPRQVRPFLQFIVPLRGAKMNLGRALIRLLRECAGPSITLSS